MSGERLRTYFKYDIHDVIISTERMHCMKIGQMKFRSTSFTNLWISI